MIVIKHFNSSYNFNRNHFTCFSTALSCHLWYILMIVTEGQVDIKNLSSCCQFCRVGGEIKSVKSAIIFANIYGKPFLVQFVVYSCNLTIQDLKSWKMRCLYLIFYHKSSKFIKVSLWLWKSHGFRISEGRFSVVFANICNFYQHLLLENLPTNRLNFTVNCTSGKIILMSMWHTITVWVEKSAHTYRFNLNFFSK